MGLGTTLRNAPFHAGRQVSQDRQAAAQQDVVAEHADEDRGGRCCARSHPRHLPLGAFLEIGRFLLFLLGRSRSSCAIPERISFIEVHPGVSEL